MEENYLKTSEFHLGLARVKNKDGKYNFVNKKGKIISGIWFDFVESHFTDRIARVGLCEKIKRMNYIRANGKLVSNTWFDFEEPFLEKSEMWAKVCLGGKYNYINRDGGFISDTWLDYAEASVIHGPTEEGMDYSAIKIGDKRAYIHWDGHITTWSQADDGTSTERKFNDIGGFMNNQGKRLARVLI